MNQLNDLRSEWVERIFLRLHGRFGNSFINKYKVGTLDSFGNDIGIANAKQVWASELAGMSVEKIKNALESNYEHAPSCDAFKANCKSSGITDFKAIAAPISKDENKRYADNVVKFVAENTIAKTDYHAWAKRIMRDPAKFPESSVQAAKEVLKVA